MSEVHGSHAVYTELHLTTSVNEPVFVSRIEQVTARCLGRRCLLAGCTHHEKHTNSELKDGSKGVDKNEGHQRSAYKKWGQYRDSGEEL